MSETADLGTPGIVIFLEQNFILFRNIYRAPLKICDIFTTQNYLNILYLPQYFKEMQGMGKIILVNYLFHV